MIIRSGFLLAWVGAAAGRGSSLPVNFVQRSRKFRQHHRLFPVRPCRNHSDLRAALPLLKSQVLLRRLGQLLKIRNPLGRRAPALQLRVDAA